MNRVLRLTAVLAFLLFCLAGQAMAVGFGVYLEGAGGDGEFKYEHSSDFDVDAEATGFGMLMDTDLSDRGVFNYRLNIGYEKLDLEDDFGTTLDLDGLVVANTFGFGLVRRPHFRWWVGPQVRMGYYTGSPKGYSTSDYELVSFGVGGVTGWNFINDNFCISTSLGLMTTGYAGEKDDLGTTYDFDGHTNTIFLNVAFLFGK